MARYRYSDLANLDWSEIGRRALAAGAATLAEAARRRALADEGAIRHTIERDDRATVRWTDTTLVRREQGQAGVQPMPLLAPDSADRHAIRAAIAESLRRDLP